MRTVAVVQARMGSARLPGKVMLPLLGQPMLTRVLRRTSRASRLDAVVVATTADIRDDPIVDLAAREGWPISRGSTDDVLDRYLNVARSQEADVVVRITSDCPIIDPEIIDLTIASFHDGDVDYVSNSLEPRTFPRGLDVEVIARSALERAWNDDSEPAWREHVTPYIYRHPELFRLRRVAAADDRSAERWSVDTPEDLELVRRIYGAFGGDLFSWKEALAVVDANPDWKAINRHIVQKTVPPVRDAR